MLTKACAGLWPKAITTRPKLTDGMRKQIRESFTIYITIFHLGMI